MCRMKTSSIAAPSRRVPLRLLLLPPRASWRPLLPAASAQLCLFVKAPGEAELALQSHPQLFTRCELCRVGVSRGESPAQPLQQSGMGRRQVVGRLQGFSGGISEVTGQRRARAGSAAPTAKWPLRLLMLPRWRRVLQHPFCKGPRTDKCLGNGSPRSPHPLGQSRVGSVRHIVPDRHRDSNTILGTAGRPSPAPGVGGEAGGDGAGKMGQPQAVHAGAPALASPFPFGHLQLPQILPPKGSFEQPLRT